MDAYPVADAVRPSTTVRPASSAYVRYVLALVWMTLLLRFLDMQIVAVILEPIKAEFALTDLKLGLLSGLAFSVLYGTLGIPAGWLADRWNRRNLMALALSLWSAMTLLCGFAPSFALLLLARVGVGIGEAGGTPPSFSLLADYVSGPRRSSAFAFINAAQPVGVFVGFMVIGTVASDYGWRAAFWAAGAPGMLLALLMLLTLREPTRGMSDALTASVSAPALRQVVRYLAGLASYRHMVAANTLLILGLAASGIWIPSYFIRVHGFTIAQIAPWLAFIYGIGGTAGAIGGGLLADNLIRRDIRNRVRFPAIAVTAAVPALAVVFLTSNPMVALGTHVFAVILMHAWLGPYHATIQDLAGAPRRSVATAVNLLVANVIGLGLGPLLVGALNDALMPSVGASAIRYSILAVASVAFLWAGLHFKMAARTLASDLERARK